MPPEMPPLDMAGGLEGPDLEAPDDDLMMPEDELNPGFAAEAELAFPELDDEGLLSLQRAIQALMGV